MRLTEINGRWPLVLPDHRADFHEVKPWWEAARLADMHAALNSWIDDGTHRGRRPTVIDVGSEEGDFTALYASWGCTVPFIDPSAPWVAQTYDTFIANELDPTPAFIGLADNHTDYEPFPVAEKRFVTIDENVPRITLDTFVDWNDLAPDAITMDVEGSELRVLEGAEMLLTENIVWWIAIHGDVNPHAEMPSSIHRHMRERGFKDQFLSYDGEWHYRFWRS